MVGLMYKPGDILFYGQGNGVIADKLISVWTGSPLVHCAVAISGAQKIESLLHGVVLTPVDERAVAAHWSYVGGDDLQAGLVWLHSQLGQIYGWGDILDAVLWKFEHAIAVDDTHFDCSALATEFLLKCGGLKQLAAITNPHVITPAALAQLLGVNA